MKGFERFKHIFLYALIASIIISAITAIISILSGDIDTFTLHLISTFLLLSAHALASLLLIGENNKSKIFAQLYLFKNFIFVVIVASLFTSISSIWNLITGDMTMKLYDTYMAILVSVLQASLLAKALNKEKYLDLIIKANYVFIALVAILIQPAIYQLNMDTYYPKLLASIGIIDATLSILTLIFYKIYAEKHPELQTTSTEKSLKIWLWVLIIYIVMQIITPLIFWGNKVLF